MKLISFILFISLTALSLSHRGNDIANCGIKQLDKPYKAGGFGPDQFDDFGLVFYCTQIINNIPCNLDRKSQATQGKKVTELDQGDVLYVYDKKYNIIGAIIYIGNSEVIYTSSYLNKGVIKSSLKNLNMEYIYDKRRNW